MTQGSYEGDLPRKATVRQQGGPLWALCPPLHFFKWSYFAMKVQVPGGQSLFWICCLQELLLARGPGRDSHHSFTPCGKPWPASPELPRSPSQHLSMGQERPQARSALNMIKAAIGWLGQGESLSRLTVWVWSPIGHALPPARFLHLQEASGQPEKEKGGT